MAHNPFDSVAYKTYRLPILATGLAGAYLVFSLVQLDADPQPIPPTTKVESHAPQTQQDFSEITGLHLFGQAALPSSADGFSVEPSQALQLKGVLYLPDNQAHAIIESSGHVQKTYRINDSLPGGAILQTTGKITAAVGAPNGQARSKTPAAEGADDASTVQGINRLRA